MIKIVLTSLFLLLAVSNSFASLSSEWDTSTIAKELIFLYTLSNDWQQTLDITRDQTLHEENHILGEHPSRNSINLYFASCAAGHALITHLLPKQYKKIWQETWIGIQASQIQHNDDIGLVQNMGLSYKLTHIITF